MSDTPTTPPESTPKAIATDTAELSPRDIEAQVERAKIKADKATAAKAKKVKKTKKSSTSNRSGNINKKQRDESYKKTIARVQGELPASNRLFSKIIHNKTVESISDFIAATIARPNALLAGSVVAFVLTLITYTVSKTIGYKLSGYETITAFIIGWVIGIVYDYLKVLITGKKS